MIRWWSFWADTGLKERRWSDKLYLTSAISLVLCNSLHILYLISSQLKQDSTWSTCNNAWDMYSTCHLAQSKKKATITLYDFFNIVSEHLLIVTLTEVTLNECIRPVHEISSSKQNLFFFFVWSMKMAKKNKNCVVLPLMWI